MDGNEYFIRDDLMGLGLARRVSLFVCFNPTDRPAGWSVRERAMRKPGKPGRELDRSIAFRLSFDTYEQGRPVEVVNSSPKETLIPKIDILNDRLR